MVEELLVNNHLEGGREGMEGEGGDEGEREEGGRGGSEGEGGRREREKEQNRRREEVRRGWWRELCLKQRDITYFTNTTANVPAPVS